MLAAHKLDTQHTRQAAWQSHPGRTYLLSCVHRDGVFGARPQPRQHSLQEQMQREQQHGAQHGQWQQRNVSVGATLLVHALA